MKVGVFDSGVGGRSVALAIQKQLPHLEVIFKNDAVHVPYGNRHVEQIYGFTKPIIQRLIDDGCQIIIIACNTVTTNLIDRLRADFQVPFIGVEPMIKPAAAASKSGVIAVCATPRTLGSVRYKWLKSQYATGVRVIEPDCADWSYMVENNRVERDKIAEIVNKVIAKKADVIVLGCTHYHWIEKLIKELAAGRAQVIQPEQAVVKQLKKLLSAGIPGIKYQDIGQHGSAKAPSVRFSAPKNPPQNKISKDGTWKQRPAASFHKKRASKSTTLVRPNKRG